MSISIFFGSEPYPNTESDSDSNSSDVSEWGAAKRKERDDDEKPVNYFSTKKYTIVTGDDLPLPDDIVTLMDSEQTQNKVDFRFIAKPHKDDYGLWKWCHIERKRVTKNKNNITGLFATEMIPRGLLIPYVGKVYSSDKLDKQNTYEFDTPVEKRVDETVLRYTVTVDGEPRLYECAGDYCAAAFVNEATYGTNEMYNCQFISLPIISTLGINCPEYNYFHGLDEGEKLTTFLLTMVDISAGDELFAYYGPRYKRKEYKPKNGQDNETHAEPNIFLNTHLQLLYYVQKVLENRKALRYSIRLEPCETDVQDLGKLLLHMSDSLDEDFLATFFDNNTLRKNTVTRKNPALPLKINKLRPGLILWNKKIHEVKPKGKKGYEWRPAIVYDVDLANNRARIIVDDQPEDDNPPEHVYIIQVTQDDLEQKNSDPTDNEVSHYLWEYMTSPEYEQQEFSKQEDQITLPLVHPVSSDSPVASDSSGVAVQALLQIFVNAHSERQEDTVQTKNVFIPISFAELHDGQMLWHKKLEEPEKPWRLANVQSIDSSKGLVYVVVDDPTEKIYSVLTVSANDFKDSNTDPADNKENPYIWQLVTWSDIHTSKPKTVSSKKHWTVEEDNDLLRAAEENRTSLGNTPVDWNAVVNKIIQNGEYPSLQPRVVNRSNPKAFLRQHWFILRKKFVLSVVERFENMLNEMATTPDNAYRLHKIYRRVMERLETGEDNTMMYSPADDALFNKLLNELPLQPNLAPFIPPQLKPRTQLPPRIISQAPVPALTPIPSLSSVSKEIPEKRFLSEVKNGNTNTVRNMLKSAVNQTTKDVALHQSSAQGNDQIVQLLLENGADPNANNLFPLAVAAQYGKETTVRILLNAGANVHASNDVALAFASENGHAGIVRLLIEQGADVHANDDEALRLAEQNRRIPVVDILKQAMN